jgi:hypothetical protein
MMAQLKNQKKFEYEIVTGNQTVTSKQSPGAASG